MAEETLAAIVRRHREERGFSQRELARLAGVDSSEISRIESEGRTRPRVETLWKIAPHLALEPTNLVRISRDLPNDADAMIAADEHAAHITARNKKRPGRQHDPELEKAFGDRLQELRAAAGIERDDLARRVGVTYAAITRYELSTIPEAAILCRLADEFGVSVDNLLGRPDRRADTSEEAPRQLRIYTTELELEGESVEDWRCFLTQLIGLTKRLGKRDRKVILNISRQLAAHK